MSTRQAALDQLTRRVLQTRNQLGGAWPFLADPATGEWETATEGDWCAGHWIEALRIAGERTGNDQLRADAARRTRAIEAWKQQDDMFRAPIFYYSAARLASTGDTDEVAEMRTLALDVADRVRTMAIPANGAMPIGAQVRVASTTLASQSLVAVDSVHPNLLLDWYAHRQTGNATYLNAARRHLDVVARDFIRDDGSTIEFVDYDLDTGTPRRKFTLLGAHDDSCWSRGQAWAIAGYLRAFEETGATEYVDIAEELMRYWTKHAGPDLIPPWDFADGDAAPPDTSAAAIVAEGLARLAVRPAHPRTSSLLNCLDPLLDGLVARVTPVHKGDRRPAGMLLDGCFNRPSRVGESHELVWGDFYLLSALHCLDVGGLPC